MPSRTVLALPGYRGLRQAAAPELPQKDDLCGPFWALAVLRALDAPDPGRQEEVARAAGTVHYTGEGGSLPPGQPARPIGVPLPESAEEATAGTTTRGIARAIDRFAGDRITVLPLRSPGAWSANAVTGVVRAAAEAGVLLIANIATSEYRFGTHEAIEEFFRTGETDGLRGSPWHVGHFAAVGGLESSPAASAVIVHDSYPLGELLGVADAGSPWEHLQPAEAFARALTRPGLMPGGLLAAGEASALESLRADAADLGVQAEWWEEPQPEAD